VSWKLTAFKPQLFHGSGRIILHSRAVPTGPIICMALIDRNIRLWCTRPGGVDISNWTIAAIER
jgi:hypothetical protein